MDPASKSALSFRPIREDDQDFLRRLYHSTRAEEMAVVPWPEEQKRIFLDQQFEAQHTFYMEGFTAAEFSILEAEGEPIGRLYLDRREGEHRLIDIALLPEARGQGLGTKLLEDVLAEAGEAGKKVRIHVERFNPALRLYDRLGFRQIEEQGPYFLMEWTPEEGT